MTNGAIGHKMISAAAAKMSKTAVIGTINVPVTAYAFGLSDELTA